MSAAVNPPALPRSAAEPFSLERTLLPGRARA